jgi:phosphoribosylamine--glycine ligase
MKILLIGGGGREHALAWKLAQSDSCETLYCAPGNAGIAAIAASLDMAADDIDGLVAFARDKDIDLVVVGPEGPLVAGIADRMQDAGIAVFGPSQSAARLEGSKTFMKEICAAAGVNTAAYGQFSDLKAATAFIAEQSFPLVVKANGLAAGKGVIIAQSEHEAVEAVEGMLTGEDFGAAGQTVVIEEFLDGEEVSFFALSDGRDFVSFGSATDYKRVGDGDTGPNTGGMGTVSPAPAMTAALHKTVESDIIHPIIETMADKDCAFQGVLFAGLMLVDGVPYVLEFNVRFGDPECQSLMRRLDGDLANILKACAAGDLAAVKDETQWRDETAVTVVMATEGYPGSYPRGTAIKDIGLAEEKPDVEVFHAGTGRTDSGQLVSTGGRVLNVTALGDDINEARRKAYEAVDLIDWPLGFCRRDIGAFPGDNEKHDAKAVEKTAVSG